jgi:hypothetical protein
MKVVMTVQKLYQNVLPNFKYRYEMGEKILVLCSWSQRQVLVYRK